MMIDSPVLDEVKQLIRAQAVRDSIVAVLESRFSAVPAEQVASLHAITDDKRLKERTRLAAPFPNLDMFTVALAGKP